MIAPEVVAEVMHRARGCCEADVHPACEGTAAHLHHRQLRRHGDHSAANLLAVCRVCHDWAHGHPADAHALGLVVWSWENPAEVPVTVHESAPAPQSRPGADTGG